MEIKDDKYSYKNELSHIKCKMEKETDNENCKDTLLLIKNEFEQEVLSEHDSKVDLNNIDDSKIWFNQINTAVFIEDVKTEKSQNQNIKCNELNLNKEHQTNSHDWRLLEIQNLLKMMPLGQISASKNLPCHLDGCLF
ncbi:unnamed protein product [Diabrotica balteata]|uniref:Uncharacterized protein n=1 Tax=Diabrotica balteata TaxID=107213 RepID=A0A9N9SMU5_DIABA|nr:unnamed protein product [Diabrotica balteata]